MSTIILITGGARSGKSRFAQTLAEAAGENRCYLATCPPPDGSDPEMTARVERHQLERQSRGWRTMEEPLQLAGAIAGEEGAHPLLVDCLTLWVSNLLLANASRGLDEDAMAQQAEAMLAAARRRAGLTLFVTNEVGLGIVPDHPLARRFRDLAGRCNQTVAAAADEVYLVTCGIPLQLKPEKP